MDATLVLIYSDAELLRARALVDQLWNSVSEHDVALCQALEDRFVFAMIPNSRPLRPELRST